MAWLFSNAMSYLQETAHCSRCHKIIPEQDLPRSKQESSLVCPSCQQCEGFSNAIGVALTCAAAGAAYYALTAAASEEPAPQPRIQCAEYAPEPRTGIRTAQSSVARPLGLQPSAQAAQLQLFSSGFTCAGSRPRHH
jgi:hypothetical protein